jgi:ABC-type dipeptide/oligopeptide/nickel transport system ATPase component
MCRGFDIICGVIKHRINKLDKSMMILIVGEMGSGKSLAAVSFACKVDPSFAKDPRIVYTVEDFIAKLNKIKKGQAIIFDEVGVNVAARDFQKLHRICRSSHKYCVIKMSAASSTPHARFVDCQCRESMNAWVHP